MPHPPIEPKHLVELTSKLRTLHLQMEAEKKATTRDHMRARALESTIGGGEATDDNVGEAITLLRRYGKA